MEVKVDKRTKAYRDGTEDGIVTVTGALNDAERDESLTVPDFMVCSEIGCTNRHPEDETFRTRPEPCYACVMRNY